MLIDVTGGIFERVSGYLVRGNDMEGKEGGVIFSTLAEVKLKCEEYGDACIGFCYIGDPEPAGRVQAWLKTTRCDPNVRQSVEGMQWWTYRFTP